MNLELTHSLDPLAAATTVDSSWLCRAARALEELDRCLARLSTEVEGSTDGFATAKRRNPLFTRTIMQLSADRQRLHNRARSLRRRLVLATKDARLGADLKAELTCLSRDASTLFHRVHPLLQDSFGGTAADGDDAAKMSGSGMAVMG